MSDAVLTIREILVEVMAREPGLGFREPIDLVGPFPSGAPASTRSEPRLRNLDRVDAETAITKSDGVMFYPGQAR